MRQSLISDPIHRMQGPGQTRALLFPASRHFFNWHNSEVAAWLGQACLWGGESDVPCTPAKSEADPSCHLRICLTRQCYAAPPR